MENFGMPFSVRPASRMGPMAAPVPLSCNTVTERTRFGPVSPQVALAPWQKAQLVVYSRLPRSTTSGGGSGGKARNECRGVGFGAFAGGLAGFAGLA